MNDLIIAIATASGKGSIGIVKISGENLKSFVHFLFKKQLIPRHAHFLEIKDREDFLIDQALVIFFPKPNSYTGEDVLEIQGHGGTIVLKRILDRCLELGESLGIRIAEPGEFTKRAFLNNRLDLVQVEAISDLISASSEAAAKNALKSLAGNFSKEIEKLSTLIIEFRSLIEISLDFSEEDIEFLNENETRLFLSKIQKNLKRLVIESKKSSILNEGLRVVIIGSPNVGKSSLINKLAGEDIAIVTNIPGTTRDKIVQNINIQNTVLTIVDTAGIRETEDEIEKVGIIRTLEEIKKAHLLIHLKDITENQNSKDSILNIIPKDIPVLTVFNKIDLINNNYNVIANDRKIFISAKKDLGFEKLRLEILRKLDISSSIESPWLSRQRHIELLENAEKNLKNAEKYIVFGNQKLELFAEELRLCHINLMKITGKFSSDDLLKEIFSGFCIGK